jgi:beta-mannosidase
LRRNDATQTIAQAFHFPLGRGAEQHELDITAELIRDAGGWALSVSAQRFAQSFHVRDENYRPDDNWFHLPPGEQRPLRLTPRKPGWSEAPRGFVSAVNSLSPMQYQDRP